jgi:hypothetical protein
LGLSAKISGGVIFSFPSASGSGRPLSVFLVELEATHSAGFLVRSVEIITQRSVRGSLRNSAMRKPQRGIKVLVHS